MKNSNETIRLRRKGIMDFLMSAGASSVDALIEQFGVSAMTMRRDLSYLEEQQLVKKNSYNQYVTNEDAAMMAKYEQRMRANLQEKTAIAKRAFEFVEPGDFLGIDSSTTTMVLCKMLTDTANLSIVTTSPILPLTLEGCDNITIMSTGGIAYRGHASYVGPITLATISMFHYDKVFFSTSAFDANLGICDVSEEVNLKLKFMERADKSYLLCDSSKLSKRSMHYLFASIPVSRVITDWKISDRELQKLESRGYSVLVAPPPNAAEKERGM